MRAAPPVSVHVAGSVPWRWARSLLPATAAAALAAWLLGHAELPARPAPFAALAAGAPAWRRSAPRDVALVCDGQRWSADDAVGELDVMIDLDSWLLLRLRPASAGAVRWIALGATEVGPALHALRAALYARPALAQAADRVAG